MMYSNNFVVCILHNGKPSEESKDGIVALPFGAEYKIRLRNKHGRRAVAKVYIDEENVTEEGIVVDARSYVDLERSTTKAVKFKFVSSASSEAIDAGKNNREDGSNGVIRVEWFLEKEVPPVPKTVYVDRPYPVPYPYPRPWPYYPPWHPPYRYDMSYGGQAKGMSASYGPTALNHTAYSEQETSGRGLHRKDLSEGCTVEGGHSSQSFYSVFVNLESTPTIIRIILKGYKQRKSSRVRHCENCRAPVKSRFAKFCWICGKRLTAVPSGV